ncbi:MAG TPA: fibronectin type III domain-containing protein [Acidimicrobiales bacterium]|nr:fibronectin type III domain-containing protein [Acidimicrobiales bacterium]
MTNLAGTRSMRRIVLVVAVIAAALAWRTTSLAAAGPTPPKPLAVAAVGAPNGTATVTWTPGVGGPAVTSYTVQAYDTKWGYAGAAVACGTCVNATVSGLIGSRTYVFYVYAVNGNGSSAPTASTMTPMPPSPATAPQDVRVEGRDRSVRVGWVPPANEGAPLTGYTVNATDGAGTVVGTATACATCTSAFVANLANGAPTNVTVIAQSTLGAGAPSPAVVATPTPVPPAITTASATPVLGGFTASWTYDPGVSAAPPDYFLVQATAFDSFSQMFACATCRSLTMTPLPQNRPYTLRIYPHNSAGYGQGPAVTVTSGAGDCAGIALCAEVNDATSPGPAQQRAQGLLHGYDTTTNGALLDDLHIKQWRVAHATPSQARAETMPDTSITVTLSDAWRGAATSGGKVQAPWANWFRYDAFVRQFVQQVRAQGHRVDYWDIQNEPLPTEFSAGPPPTTELWWEEYRVAYNAIKAADPDAKIVAPTVPHALWPGDRNAPSAVDLLSFMNYADAHDLHFDAYSWHELGISQPGYYDSPQRVIDDVQAARTALASHPNLGNAQLFVNEYMPASNALLPAHMAGFIAALEDANIDQANTTCHEYSFGPAFHDCSTPTLDGALTSDLSSPRGIYWVRQQYAAMTGDRLATSTSHPSISVLATTPTNRTYKVMLSRHQSCVRALNAYCTQTPAATPAAAPVTLKLRTASGPATTVTAQMVPVGVGAQPALVDVTGLTITTDATGVTTVVVPNVNDGDVYILTITAA